MEILPGLQVFPSNDFLNLDRHLASVALKSMLHVVHGGHTSSCWLSCSFCSPIKFNAYLGCSCKVDLISWYAFSNAGPAAGTSVTAHRRLQDRVLGLLNFCDPATLPGRLLAVGTVDRLFWRALAAVNSGTALYT